MNIFGESSQGYQYDAFVADMIIKRKYDTQVVIGPTLA